MHQGAIWGIGFATYWNRLRTGRSVRRLGFRWCPGYDQAFVKLTPDGALEVKAGIHSIGQGLETTLAQIRSP